MPHGSRTDGNSNKLICRPNGQHQPHRPHVCACRWCIPYASISCFRQFALPHTNRIWNRPVLMILLVQERAQAGQGEMQTYYMFYFSHSEPNDIVYSTDGLNRQTKEPHIRTHTRTQTHTYTHSVVVHTKLLTTVRQHIHIRKHMRTAIHMYKQWSCSCMCPFNNTAETIALRASHKHKHDAPDGSKKFFLFFTKEMFFIFQFIFILKQCEAFLHIKISPSSTVAVNVPRSGVFVCECG